MPTSTNPDGTTHWTVGTKVKLTRTVEFKEGDTGVIVHYDPTASHYQYTVEFDGPDGCGNNTTVLYMDVTDLEECTE